MASLITLGLGGTAGEFLLLGFGSAAVSNPNAFECGTFDSEYGTDGNELVLSKS